jgi:hypothetical protein
MWFLPPRNSHHIYLATLVIRGDQDLSLNVGWHFVNVQVLSGILKALSAFIIRVKQYKNGLLSFRTHRTMHPVTKHHIPEDWNLQSKNHFYMGNLTHNVELLTVAVTSVRFCLLCTWSILQTLQQLLYTFWDDHTIHVHNYIGAGS